MEKQYTITGKADGIEYGIYAGTDPRAAVQAMLDDAGTTDAPDMEAWKVTEAARVLGSRTSPRKAQTSRENGKLGGRPRKSPRLRIT